MVARYDDPDFSKRYDLVVADGTDPVVAMRQATAAAWNREYVESGAPPLTKYTQTDPHIIRMAEVYGVIVKQTGS